MYVSFVFLCYLLMNIPMKHRTIKAIASPPSTAGMSFNISFTLSNAPLNVRLSYSQLIESVFHNPIMKAIGGKIMNKSPKICAIVTKKCVIPNLRCYGLINC